jgi:predicted metalloprotease
MAYVLAHEIGHHAEFARSAAAGQEARCHRKAEADSLQVRARTTQADCFAGVWASRAPQQ